MDIYELQLTFPGQYAAQARLTTLKLWEIKQIVYNHIGVLPTSQIKELYGCGDMRRKATWLQLLDSLTPTATFHEVNVDWLLSQQPEGRVLKPTNLENSIQNIKDGKFHQTVVYTDWECSDGFHNLNAHKALGIETINVLMYS